LVDVVIVNWNAGAQLAACLASLIRAESAASSPVVQSVIVVDNGSSDGSAERLPDHGLCPTILRNRANRGFAAACNQGAALGSAEFVLFLNPDTRLEPTTLTIAVAGLRRATGSAAAGVQLQDEQGQTARSCARFPTVLTMTARAIGADRLWPARLSYVMSEWDHGYTRTVDHVIGAFYLVRRSTYASVGGFDERFFVYLEDVDLSRRMADAGWTCLYLAEARAYHRGGGTSDRVKSRRLAYALRSRLVYAAKHFSWPGLASVCITTLVLEPIIRLLRAAMGLSIQECRHTIGGFAWLWRDLVRYGLQSQTSAAAADPRESSG
jgi:N-acetylglucosaminyl-diphospho-decaprenol L-rhamnosyltransferase